LAARRLHGRSRRARKRRIGVLLPAAADDAEWQAWVGAFLQALALMGWTTAHISRETRAWLAEQPAGRFEFTFTPKHGSWLRAIS
jgi:hypothetical protein